MANHFPETVQVLLDYGRGFGRYFAEAKPGDKLEGVVEDIFSGQFSGNDTYVVAVYVTGLGVTTADVSNQVCDKLFNRICEGEEPSDQAKAFLEWCEHAGYREHVEYLATITEAAE